jgi:NOL1/NOP2/sun family putative RNA methylase
MVVDTRVVFKYLPGITVQMEKDIEYIEQLKAARSFIRVNTLKMPIEEYLESASLVLVKTRIPFMFSVAEGNPGTTLEYKAGWIHPQSLSSSVVPLVFSSFDEKDAVFDVAASPGSKFTEMAMLMKGKGIAVANDQEERLDALLSNIARLGVLNAIVTVGDAKKLDIKETFDKVLLDAPCTALGSHPFAWERINKRSLQVMPDVQKKMIYRAFEALKPGGTLVYSTCTVTQQENEEVVEYLLRKFGNAKLENIGLDLPHSSGLPDFGAEFRKTWRISPKDLESEGFFIAKIKKE